MSMIKYEGNGKLLPNISIKSGLWRCEDFAMHNGSVFQISASAYRNMSLKVSNLHLSSKRFHLLVNYVTRFPSSMYTHLEIRCTRKHN